MYSQARTKHTFVSVLYSKIDSKYAHNMKYKTEHGIILAISHQVKKSTYNLKKI